MSPSNELSSTQASPLSRLEKTLIDLWCRDTPCTVHRAFEAERGSTVAVDATDRDPGAAFYDVCLEVCRQVHFCPLRFGHGVSDAATETKTAKAV